MDLSRNQSKSRRTGFLARQRRPGKAVLLRIFFAAAISLLLHAAAAADRPLLWIDACEGEPAEYATVVEDLGKARVVYLGDDCDKGRRIGIEFLTPAPRFWGVEFTQPDWVPAQRN